MTGPLVKREKDRLGRHLRDHLEAGPLEVQVESMAGAAEPVLGHLENPAAEQLGPLVLFNRELHHGIDHVLEHVPTRELSVFTDLADDDRAGIMLLTPVGDESQSTLRGAAIGRTVGVLAVVHGLEAVHNEDELLVGMLCSELVTVLKQCGDVNLLTHRETVLELETLGSKLHLVETLLSSVEDRKRPVTYQAVDQLEHHGRLSRSRGTGEQGDR